VTLHAIWKARRAGFTLIELTMVIAILALASMLSIPRYRSYQVRHDLNLATEQIIQGMARAKLFAQAAKNDSAWGFYAPSGTLYMGDSYAERDQAFDEIYPMPNSITASGTILEVAYSKLEGAPSQTGSIVLIAQEEQRTIVVEIAVHRESIAMNLTDRITICHKPGTSEQATKEIPDAAWPGHQRHGDVIGLCPPPPAGSSSSAATTWTSRATWPSR